MALATPSPQSLSEIGTLSPSHLSLVVLDVCRGRPTLAGDPALIPFFVDSFINSISTREFLLVTTFTVTLFSKF